MMKVDITLIISILAFSFTIVSGLVVYVWNSSLKKINENFVQEKEARNELKASISKQNEVITDLAKIAKSLEIMVAVHEVEINMKKTA